MIRALFLCKKRAFFVRFCGLLTHRTFDGHVVETASDMMQQTLLRFMTLIRIFFVSMRNVLEVKSLRDWLSWLPVER